MRSREVKREGSPRAFCSPSMTCGISTVCTPQLRSRQALGLVSMVPLLSPPPAVPAAAPQPAELAAWDSGGSPPPSPSLRVVSPKHTEKAHRIHTITGRAGRRKRAGRSLNVRGQRRESPAMGWARWPWIPTPLAVAAIAATGGAAASVGWTTRQARPLSVTTHGAGMWRWGGQRTATRTVAARGELHAAVQKTGRVADMRHLRWPGAARVQHSPV